MAYISPRKKNSYSSKLVERIKKRDPEAIEFVAEASFNKEEDKHLVYLDNKILPFNFNQKNLSFATLHDSLGNILAVNPEVKFNSFLLFGGILKERDLKNVRIRIPVIYKEKSDVVLKEIPSEQLDDKNIPMDISSENEIWSRRSEYASGK